MAPRSFFAAVIVAIACMLVLSVQSQSVAASSSTARVEVGDDDEDEDNWDFMDDEAILGLSSQQGNAETRGHKKECVDLLPIEFVDDDYCDCDDGSDEPSTSACSHVLLLSRTAPFSRNLKCKADDKTVALAFVGDSVCDCCDGSDERYGLCNDTCATEWMWRLETLRERLETVLRGQDRRTKYLIEAANTVQQLHTDFTRLSEAYQTGTRRFEDLQRRLQHDPKLVGQVEQSYHVLRQLQYSTYVQSRVTDQSTFSDAKWKLAYAELVGQCFTHTVNEKELKGGGPNVIPRKYDVVFCPFQNISQTEPFYLSWKKAEHQAKVGHVAEDDDSAESVPHPISLGVWSQWQDSIGFTRAQDYTHGVPCASGQERRTRVELSCGAQNRVLSVEERAMCEYDIRFETPAACEVAEQDAVQDEIARIEAFRTSKDVGKRIEGREEL